MADMCMQGVSPVLVDAMAAAVGGIESFTKISDVTTEQFTALFTGVNNTYTCTFELFALSC
jgi:hypothetical protein